MEGVEERETEYSGYRPAQYGARRSHKVTARILTLLTFTSSYVSSIDF